MTAYADRVFASIDADHSLERVAGGNETEVYRSDDGRYVAKLKAELGGSRDEALARARALRAAAESFADCLGPRYSIPSHYLLARDGDGRVQILVIQPYLCHARALCAIDYSALGADERRRLADDLREIIARAEAMHRAAGAMPDLYGRTSSSSAERKRNRSPLQIPRRLWSFLVERTLLQSHNLMRTDDPAQPVVLVDYDPVRRSALYRAVYYLVRRVLFWRDRLAIRMTLGS
jgi:hypothetical protein